MRALDIKLDDKKLSRLDRIWPGPAAAPRRLRLVDQARDLPLAHPLLRS